MRAILPLLALLLSAPPVACGNIYKCVGADGGLIYSDKPCKAGSKPAGQIEMDEPTRPKAAAIGGAQVVTPEASEQERRRALIDDLSKRRRQTEEKEEAEFKAAITAQKASEAAKAKEAEAAIEKEREEGMRVANERRARERESSAPKGKADAQNPGFPTLPEKRP